MNIAEWENKILAKSRHCKHIGRYFFPLSDVHFEYLENNDEIIEDKQFGSFQCYDVVLPDKVLKNGAMLLMSARKQYPLLINMVTFSHEVFVSAADTIRNKSLSK